MMKRFLPFCILTLWAASSLRALVNPTFTPVQLTAQSTAIWEAEVRAGASDDVAEVRVTETLKGEAPSERYVLDFGDRDHLVRDVKEALEQGAAKGMFLRGTFGEDEDRMESPWAMLKLGTRWYMIVEDEGGTLRFREDPIDLSTVWAGDPENLRQVVSHLLENPRSDVPVRSGGRWAEERKLGEIEGTVTGMEAVNWGEATRVMVYRKEGDRVLDPGGAYKDLAEELGLESASVHAAWGRFTGKTALSMMSLRENGTLELWVREGERFERRSTGISLDNATDMAVVAEPGRAALAVGTPEGVRLIRADGAESWDTLVLEPAEEAEAGGPVYAIDMDGDGIAEVMQLHANGLSRFRADGEGGFEGHFVSHANIGEAVSLQAVDLDGDGTLDLLGGGERGAVLLLNDGEGNFRERMAASGELDYNIRPGVNAIGTGDHNRDGRMDLVLFNRELPPQVYFNRGYAVFGYDMELDLMEDAPDAQYAAGQGQQGGVLADLTGNGFQELLMVTRMGGELWLLTREAESAPALVASLAGPASLTGPAPVRAYEGERPIGARVTAPQAPARLGRRNRGPVDLRWRFPGDAEETARRILVLRPEAFVLEEER